MCVDFRDLNKASPKDEFSLPHIDVLVDNIAGHALFAFMDGFSGYNQIKMALKKWSLHGGHTVTTSYHLALKMLVQLTNVQLLLCCMI